MLRFNDLELMFQKLEDIDSQIEAMREELFLQWNTIAKKDCDSIVGFDSKTHNRHQVAR